MFLAWRELVFARARFGLMGGVVALIAVLVVLLSGLASGLVNDGVSGLQRLPVTAFAFAQGTKTDSAFSRSSIELAQADTWKKRDGVADAAPFGNMLANAKARTAGGAEIPIDLALFGVDPGSFLSPEVSSGARLGADLTGIVVSQTVLDEGLSIGDTVTIDRLGTRLTIVGTTGDQRTFGHVDVAYIPLRAWQRMHAGAGPADEVRESAYQEATAVALRLKDGAGTDAVLAAGDTAAGTTSMMLKESYSASPGYTAETSTLTLIQVFLYAISALVVGAFFTVWTIQRRHELAVVRAMGASTGYLMRDTMIQAAVILVTSTAVGFLVGVGGGAFLTETPMPFALEAAPLAFAALLLIFLGLAGAATAVGRVVRIDPLTALGGNR
ncbi:ABC transporter permease [Streptosporangium sp. NPDC051023]|uniref:ABC transporter permease n=1 Tax=Streptosporangium sp. NPDC051023 TaxID=3155410 RepID=UPI00344DD92E